MYIMYTGWLDSNYFFIRRDCTAAFMFRTFSSLSLIHVDSDCGKQGGGGRSRFYDTTVIFDRLFTVGAL